MLGWFPVNSLEIILLIIFIVDNNNKNKYSQSGKNSNSLAESSSKIRGTAQLPVFRVANNILFLVISSISHLPRKLTRFTDLVTEYTNILLREISIANELSGEERIYHIKLALAHSHVVRTQIALLGKLNLLSNITVDGIRVKLKDLQSQLVAWKDSIKNVGASNNTKTGNT